MPLQTQPQTPADPTADVPQHESELTSFLAKQMARGVPPVDVLIALLSNFHALAIVHPCCTAAAGKSALNVGGHLVVAAIERPANATTH